MTSMIFENFIEADCVFDSSLRLPVAELYDAYIKYIKANNIQDSTLGKKEFKAAIKGRGANEPHDVEIHRVDGRHFWYGIGLESTHPMTESEIEEDECHRNMSKHLRTFAKDIGMDDVPASKSKTLLMKAAGYQ